MAKEHDSTPPCPYTIEQYEAWRKSIVRYTQLEDGGLVDSPEGEFVKYDDVSSLINTITRGVS